MLSSSFIIIDEIATKLDDLNSSLSSTIDTINTNVNEVKSVVGAINTNTAVNNAASTTGTLSQKLSSVISTLNTVSSDVNTLKGKSFCKISGGTKTATIGEDGRYYLNISGAWIASNIEDLTYTSCGYGKTKVSTYGKYAYISFSNN